jgi:hypothetical protein
VSRAKIITDKAGLYYGIGIQCPAGHTHVLFTDFSIVSDAAAPAIMFTEL